MKKKLLTLGMLSVVLISNAQLIVDTKAAATTAPTMHIEKDALVYTSGGFEAKEGSFNAVDNFGNMMVNKSELPTGKFTIGNVGTDDPTTKVTMKRTGADDYGQLHITGLAQSEISGRVNKEFAAITNHGSYQQIALPFYGLTMGDLALSHQLNAGSILTAETEINQARYKGRVMLWNNNMARFDHVTSAYSTSAGKPYDYYIINKTGTYNAGWTPNTQVTIKGTPFADVETATLTLSNGGSGASFGATGDERNVYNEKYKTYIYDPFETTPWAGTFGKNLYQLGNPFLTNLDLSKIGVAESDPIPDGVEMSTIVGVRREPGGGVTYSSTTGTVSSADAVKITYTNGLPTAGDVDKTIIRPLEAFYIKLSDASSKDFNMNGTRRFAKTARVNGDATVLTNLKSSSDKVRQVRVIAKDANGLEVGRTYYAVAPFAENGRSDNANLQAKLDGATSNIYTNEEVSQGGIDNNSTDYKLYINEANDATFKGKEIPLTINNAIVTSLSFELFENGEKVSALTGGEDFFIKDAAGVYTMLDENTNFAVNSSNYGLYYAKGQGALSTTDLTSSNNTFVTRFNQTNDFIVIFNKKQSKANVEVYSTSGQLVFTKNNVKTSEDLALPLSNEIKTSYVVKIIYQNGDIVTKKIIK